jgi:proteasome beta subunit
MTDEPRIPPFAGGGPIGANPSFFDLVSSTRPALTGAGTAEGMIVPHGTTVLGLKFRGGMLMAGDRRATEGYSIADDRMDKVFAADDFSAIAIAGVAGQAVEIVKLFQLELEHYEKITGDRLSLEGKANRLAQMIRGNFPLAVQGLVVVPLFGGFDDRRGEGRIFYYDATGGRWEERDFHTTGSGGRPARTSLKKRWRPDMERPEAVRVAVEALVDASQEDVATGGVDLPRGIYPRILVVTADGVQEVPEDEVRAAYDTVTQGPGGGRGASAGARTDAGRRQGAR